MKYLNLIIFLLILASCNNQNEEDYGLKVKTTRSNDTLNVYINDEIILNYNTKDTSLIKIYYLKNFPERSFDIKINKEGNIYELKNYTADYRNYLYYEFFNNGRLNYYVPFEKSKVNGNVYGYYENGVKHFEKECRNDTDYNFSTHFQKSSGIRNKVIKYDQFGNTISEIFYDSSGEKITQVKTIKGAN